MAKEIIYRKLSELKKLPNNPRTIKKDDMERLKKSIKDNPDYFEARPIILSNRTGELVILAGNQRYEAAKALGMDEVPTFLLEGLTEAREHEIIIRDNVSNGEWDMDALANEWDTQELTDWGVDITWDEPEQEVIEDEAPEVDESEPADSELGKVYHLGSHRLMCGDSTDAGSVAILMDGQKADMVFTDPPYGVNMSRSLVSGKDNSIMNDNLSFEGMSDLLEKSILNCKNSSKENSPIYVWIGFRNYSKAEKVIKKYYNISNCIVWVEPSIGLGGNGYRFQHELCIFSGTINDKSLSDVWEFDRDKSGIHPTIKPIKLVSYAINNSSENEDIVLDLFGGSGSTLIACEQLGRKCYMMELDPKYCDVIRKRYWKFVTGSEEGWQDGTKAK